jgi:hypothetical protein
MKSKHHDHTKQLHRASSCAQYKCDGDHISKSQQRATATAVQRILCSTNFSNTADKSRIVQRTYSISILSNTVSQRGVIDCKY